MATITLYAGKVNQMSRLINHAKKAIKEYKSDLKSLKSKVLSIAAYAMLMMLSAR